MGILKKVACLILISATAQAADYYVATTGSDSNPGTLSAPLKTISQAYSLASAGSTVYVRGGVYPLPSRLILAKSGTSANPIRVVAYPGETPILDGSGDSTLWQATLQVTGSYNYVKGFEVRNAPEYGAMIEGSGTGNTFELLNVHDSGRIGSDGKGIVIYGSSSNNLILNCDSHHNHSNPVGNADGYHMGSNGLGNVLRGNRAWRNSDDGFDTWNGAPALIEGNVSWENGYDDSLNRLGDGNGFKLGGNGAGQTSGGHMVRYNVSFRNPGNGFDENSAAKGDTLYNNSAYQNGPVMPGGVSWAMDYYFFRADHVLKNNASVSGYVHESGDSSHNSWNLAPAITAAAFASLDYSALTGPRQADGSLPYSNFMRLAAGSRLIDAGVDVGLPYLGAAPDIGAYEYGAAVVGPTPTPVPAPAPTPVATSSPSPSANLVKNPGFENGGTAWVDWGNTAIVSTTANSGTYSLRAGSAEGGRVQILSGIAPGAAYVVQFAARRSATTSEWCGVGFEFKDVANNVLSSGSASVTSTRWQSQSFQIVAPAKFSTARIYIYKNRGSARCYFDDMAVTAK